MSLDTIMRRRMAGRRPAVLTAVLLRGSSMRLLETVLAAAAIATAMLLGLGR